MTKEKLSILKWAIFIERQTKVVHFLRLNSLFIENRSIEHKKIFFKKLIENLWRFRSQYFIFWDLKHFNNNCMNCFFSHNKEEIHHKLIQLRSWVIVRKKRKIMLTEHAKAVHTKLIDKIKYLWHSLRNFLLKLIDDFDDVVVSKDCVHPYDNLSHDQENIFFYFNVNYFE